MIEKLLVLEREVERDLEVLDGLWSRLETASPTADVAEEQLIAISYRLHNLYGACENIFRNIAATFDAGRKPAPGQRLGPREMDEKTPFGERGPSLASEPAPGQRSEPGRWTKKP